MYKPRWMTDRLKLSENVFPALTLTGARQTGKSTLLSNEPMSADCLHVNLDDLVTMMQAHDDPQGFVNQADRMVIDEVLRVPDLFISVKKAVDDDRSRRSRSLVCRLLPLIQVEVPDALVLLVLLDCEGTLAARRVLRGNLVRSLSCP